MEDLLERLEQVDADCVCLLEHRKARAAAATLRTHLEGPGAVFAGAGSTPLIEALLDSGRTVAAFVLQDMSVAGGHGMPDLSNVRALRNVIAMLVEAIGVGQRQMPTRPLGATLH